MDIFWCALRLLIFFVSYHSSPCARIPYIFLWQNFCFLCFAEQRFIIPADIIIFLQVFMHSSEFTVSVDDLENLDLEQATRRITSEQLIKLEEVKTINSTAVRLFWKRKKVEDMVEGYYIKWRGPPRSNINQWVIAEACSSRLSFDHWFSKCSFSDGWTWAVHMWSRMLWTDSCRSRTTSSSWFPTTSPFKELQVTRWMLWQPKLVSRRALPCVWFWLLEVLPKIHGLCVKGFPLEG